MVNAHLKKRILDLWVSDKFPGSYSGIQTFRTCLRLYANIDISYANLAVVMRSNRNFAFQIQRTHRFKRTHYSNLSGYFSVVQADLCQFPEFDNLRFALLVLDIFSGRVFGFPIVNKKAKTVEHAFEKVWKQSDSLPGSLYTDQGSEFIGSRAYFKRKNIPYFVKTKVANKCDRVEAEIRVITLN